MAHALPEHGGCWYCHDDDPRDDAYTCCEFDTWLHLSCLKKELAKPRDPQNFELELIATEFKELL